MQTRELSACQSGEQHLNYVWYGRIREGRVSMYIPQDLVAEVQRALDNGRAIRELLYEAGERYANALKRQRSVAEAG